MDVEIRSLLAGKVKPFARGEASAIAKAALPGVQSIGVLGVSGDEQADARFHGGPEKALHHYPFDHYDRWKKDAPDHPLLGAPGAFGENVSTLGVIEDNVCIGDLFRLGTALIQISQPRQPCWKQAARMQWTTLPQMMVREGRSGWYYRVIEEGEAAAGDRFALVERLLPDWSVHRVFWSILGGGWKQDPSSLTAIRDLTLLEEGWRALAAGLIR